MGLLLSTNKTQPESNKLVETPVETPKEIPKETSVETPVETPKETPVETSVETPVETPIVSEVKLSTESHNKIDEEIGRKIEVVPVDVAESDDIIKKNKKRKNKNKY